MGCMRWLLFSYCFHFSGGVSNRSLIRAHRHEVFISSMQLSRIFQWSPQGPQDSKRNMVPCIPPVGGINNCLLRRRPPTVFVSFNWTTLDGRNPIEIPNNHLACNKHPAKNGMNYQPQVVSRISEPSTIWFLFAQGGANFSHRSLIS